MADASAASAAAGDPLDELAAAAAERERLEDRVSEVGRESVDRVASAYEGATDLMDRYEDRATDYDDFEGYVEFQDTFVSFVEDLPDDLPRREAFEAADETFQRSRLTEKHFAEAREALAPARELAELRDDLAAARDRYAAAFRAAKRRLADLREREQDLLSVLALGEADLDAPVAELRHPVAAYDEAVAEAFDAFLADASARRVFDFLEDAAAYPLVGFERPPARLREYVETASVGAKPVGTLLEYADYSTSKLQHYVDDPSAHRRHVATNRTYLDGLSASPLSVSWPPPPASALRWRCRELVPVVSRFAPDDVVRRVREVAALARDAEHYGRLREAACSLDELTADERERLSEGAVAPEYRRVSERRAALADAIDEYPQA